MWTRRRKAGDDMPTEKRHLWYTPQRPEWIFWDRNKSGPLGNRMTFPVGVEESLSLDPGNFGAVYNVPGEKLTAEILDRNYRVIRDMIDAMPDSGGCLRISGHLQYAGMIENPMRIFGVQPDSRPIPFWVMGSNPNAALVNMDSQTTAVRLTDGYSFQQANSLAERGVACLSIFSQGKCLEVLGGGKSTRVYDLTLTGVKTALTVKDFDGGSIGVHCVECRGDAIVFDKCHQCIVYARVRRCDGRGLSMSDCVSWDLSADIEDCLGYGLWAEDCKMIRATGWQESDNNSRDSTGRLSGQNTPQGCLIRSQFDFNGSWGQDRGVAFEMDTFSRLSCTFAGRIEKAKLAPYKLPIWFPPKLSGIRPERHPIVDVTASVLGLTLTSRPGSYSAQPDNISSNWLEIYPYNMPEKNLTIRPGESIILRMAFQASQEAAQYFRDRNAGGTNTPAIKVSVKHNGVKEQTQNVYLHDTGTMDMEIVCHSTTASEDGVTDNVRVFMYICPVKLSGFEPPLAHAIKVWDWSLFHLRS